MEESVFCMYLGDAMGDLPFGDALRILTAGREVEFGCFVHGSGTGSVVLSVFHRVVHSTNGGRLKWGRLRKLWFPLYSGFV